MYVLHDDSSLASQPSSSVPVNTITIEGNAPARCVINSTSASLIVSSAFVGLDVSQSSGVHGNLIAANGGQLGVVDKIDLTPFVGGIKFHHCFVVIRDFAFPILLGSDFLRYVYALILYGDGTVTFQSPRFSSTVTLPIFSVANDQVRPDFLVNLSSGSIGRLLCCSYRLALFNRYSRPDNRHTFWCC